MQDSTKCLKRRPTATTVLRPLHAARSPHHRTRAVSALTRGAKGLVAALLSWEVASWWLPGQQYLAVATALLMVNAW
ncbi:hypothetical protein ABT314_38710 [Streptomyces spiralis]